MKNLKETAGTISHDTKTTVKNGTRLIEAASLLVVAYYNFFTALQGHVNPFEFKIRIIASVVIGLRGAYEFLRYLAQKEAK